MHVILKNIVEVNIENILITEQVFSDVNLNQEIVEKQDEIVIDLTESNNKKSKIESDKEELQIDSQLLVPEIVKIIRKDWISMENITMICKGKEQY